MYVQINEPEKDYLYLYINNYCIIMQLHCLLQVEHGIECQTNIISSLQVSHFMFLCCKYQTQQSKANYWQLHTIMMQEYFRTLFQYMRNCIKIYEEESKSNLNMAIKSQNHVVDGCTTDMLCPPTWGTSAGRPVGLMGNMTPANNSQDGRPLGSMHERGAACSYPIFG
jgi:hypothetical protein